MILSPGSKRTDQLVEQRESIVLTPKNVQVLFLLLFCYVYIYMVYYSSAKSFLYCFLTAS